MAPKKAPAPAGASAAKGSKQSGGGSASAAGSTAKQSSAKQAAKPAAKSAAAEKASKKQEKAAQEAARQAAIDDMMNPDCESLDDDSDCEQPQARSGETGKAFRPPARTEKSKEQREQEREAEARLREEAKQRREEKAAERERERAEKAADKGSSSGKDLAAVLEKVEKVGAAKLSNKERRLYTKHLEKMEEEKAEQEAQVARAELGAEMVRLEEELKAFSVSVAGGNEPTAGAVDLRLEQFSISAGGQRLLDDASLTLAKGRRYGLLGPNGGGKTTLLKHLAARKLPVPEQWSIALVQQEAEATEFPVVDEVLASDVNRRKLLAEEAQLLAKLESTEDSEADASSLADLCQRLAAVGEELEASGAEAAEARVRKILCGLGFTTSMAEGPVSVLSGGWRMRVSLAKALFLEPDLLLLDEPTNHLDLDAVLWLDDYLCSYSKTLLVVSHDADFLDSVCTDVVHLEESKLIQYRGGYTEFKRGHAARVREREKEFKKQQEEKKAGKKRHPDEVVEKIKDYVVKFRFLPPNIEGSDRGGISVHDVDFSYTGKKPWLLKGLNFRVDESTRVAVVGPNGTGKSTLLNLVSKVLHPCEGEVVHSRKVTVCRYSQHFDEIAPALHMSGVQFLTSPELRRFGAGTENPELAHKCLGQFGLPSHAHTRPMKELSGGQKARVCFASITCRKPEILILDEPTNHLDIESVEALIDALKKYEGGLMLVSHDARLIQAAGCDLWVCKGAGEPLGKAANFEEYRKKVLMDLAKRQAAAEAEAARRAAARKKRRTETLGRRSRSS
eukprot:TRINITY_DN47117_c0_g1_i1.p1 TRINITY_DN47117_c0_g1~~TRINITY_DN47117_c0_g1_i1.p1  ORF type:complete len:790 (+),score=219.51 TRINITY_DN47117_c0_g1_i1:33-2402(+)